MGSAASGQTRAYTVENQGSVIDISDNVVKRLKNQLGELGKDFVTTHLFVGASHFHNKVNFVMQPANVDAQQTHPRPLHSPHLSPCRPTVTCQGLRRKCFRRSCDWQWPGNPDNLREQPGLVTQLSGHCPGAGGCVEQE